MRIVIGKKEKQQQRKIKTILPLGIPHGPLVRELSKKSKSYLRAGGYVSATCAEVNSRRQHKYKMQTLKFIGQFELVVQFVWYLWCCWCLCSRCGHNCWPIFFLLFTIIFYFFFFILFSIGIFFSFSF